MLKAKRTLTVLFLLGMLASILTGCDWTVRCPDGSPNKDGCGIYDTQTE